MGKSHVQPQTKRQFYGTFFLTGFLNMATFKKRKPPKENEQDYVGAPDILKDTGYFSLQCMNSFWIKKMPKGCEKIFSPTCDIFPVPFYSFSDPENKYRKIARQWKGRERGEVKKCCAPVFLFLQFSHCLNYFLWVSAKLHHSQNKGGTTRNASLTF